MAYSIDWAAKVVTIPKADTTFVSSSPDVRELDATVLWTNLIDIQDDEAGINFVDIVRNVPPVSVGGITLARVVEIVNGYTLTFEDGAYAVNVIGGNTNVADVTNKNQVSVNTSNSAGLAVPALTPEQSTALSEMYLLLGLDAAKPLIVSATRRRVDDGAEIDQVVSEAAGVVTVQRV